MAKSLDVYEQEGDLFFEDFSNTVIQDDVFERLLTPYILITGYQAFFTVDALTNIVQTTLANISTFKQGKSCPNQIKLEALKAVGCAV